MGRLQRHGAVLSEEIRAIAQTTGQPPESVTTTVVREMRPELGPLIEEVEALLGEIVACGGELKGLALGLVDFPAEVDGEVVLLCWQYGEKEVAYYHSREAGFTGRKPLDRPNPPTRYLQ